MQKKMDEKSENFAIEEKMVKEMQLDDNNSPLEVEMEEIEDTVHNNNSNKNPRDHHSTYALSVERGEGSNVVFSRESPLIAKDRRSAKPPNCNTKKPKSTALSSIQDRDPSRKVSDQNRHDKRLSRHERIRLGQLFRGAVSSRDWGLAESLMPMADAQALNDLLCLGLDAIWFLTTREELQGITGLIKTIVANGASDFVRAVLRTSFLASCVSACQSRTTSLADRVNVMAQRFYERLQEYHGDEILNVEAGAKVQRFTEWAFKCIMYYSNSQEKNNGEKGSSVSILEVQFQLSAFKSFLDLVGNNLTGKDFTEAFDAVCFPLTLFSSLFEPDWSSGVSAFAIQGLLGMLVEWGADNVSQCFLEASRFGSTELVRILLQIAQRNSLDIDVDLALGFASHYCKIQTMACLVDEGNAVAFLGPLMRAAEHGCLPVVQWFVGHGCRDMELCLALTAATSAGRTDVAAYVLSHIPGHILSALGVEILKAAGDRSGGSVRGIAFLLQSDFLGDPAATYAAADRIARSEGEAVAPELKAFLRDHWSEAAFDEGITYGEDHFVNFTRILKRGESAVRLRDLPRPLVIAMAYLPLYRECVGHAGRLLPQRLRGQLVEAARRLEGGGGRGLVARDAPKEDVLAVVRRHLPRFLI